MCAVRYHHVSSQRVPLLGLRPKAHSPHRLSACSILPSMLRNRSSARCVSLCSLRPAACCQSSLPRTACEFQVSMCYARQRVARRFKHRQHGSIVSVLRGALMDWGEDQLLRPRLHRAAVCTRSSSWNRRNNFVSACAAQYSSL